MLKRAIYITSAVSLSVKSNQLVIKPKDDECGVKQVPIEDIGFVIIEHQQTMITIPAMNALSDNNVSLVFCGQNMMPRSMLMNLDTCSVQGERYRAQIEASVPTKKQLWQQIVAAKIRNQSQLLYKLGKNGQKLAQLCTNVKSGDVDNREGLAAKIYWKELFGPDFYRSRDAMPPNNLLNYGYTILRAAVTRGLMGSGLFPAFGLFHRNRSNAFPLADDMMEPYRPYVDEVVYRLYNEGVEELNKDVKSQIVKLLFSDTCFKNITRPMDIGITYSCASLAKFFAGSTKKLNFPEIRIE
ncbi:MAG: type II CRISPR-associated endonuclease Cas1 [Muribaculaceae bacterium]|nr:type II CRISPR-associated endonuclease Cas1 [Muribaculaceae bacterium]